MEPQYKTTVAKMIEHIASKLAELGGADKEVRLASAISAMSFDGYCYVVGRGASSRTKHQHNLKYLQGCNPDEEVTLTREEWEIYFNGADRR